MLIKRDLDDTILDYLNDYRIHMDDVKYKNTKNHLKNNNVEYNCELPNLKHFIIKNIQKIFYKFIIPKEIRADILNELYIRDILKNIHIQNIMACLYQLELNQS